MSDERDFNGLEPEDGPVDDRSANEADGVAGGALGRGPAANPPSDAPAAGNPSSDPSSDAPAAGGSAPEGVSDEPPVDRRGAREAPDEPPTSWDYSDTPPTDWNYSSSGSGNAGGTGRRKKGAGGNGGGRKRGRRTAIALVAVLVVAVVGLVAAIIALWPCDHEWAEATCTEPATCTKCGETEGEALGHDWIEATCTEPETCSRCGETGEDALGHDWEDATCTEPKTCSRCGETEGEALGHDVEEWTVTLEPTCGEEGTETGICTRCGEEFEEAIEPTGEHTEGEWTYNATSSQKELLCAVCGEVMKTQDAEIYPAGDYIVGEDLPAGEYKLVYDGEEEASLDNYNYAYYSTYADASMEETYYGDRFLDCVYITVSDGQYVRVDDAVIVAIDDAEPTTDISGMGMYKVGFDIDAGSYLLTVWEDVESPLDYGVVGIYNSSDVADVWNMTDYEDWEMFEESYSITVSDGQYVQLQRVDIE